MTPHHKTDNLEYRVKVHITRYQQTQPPEGPWTFIESNGRSVAVFGHQVELVKQIADLLGDETVVELVPK